MATSRTASTPFFASMTWPPLSSSWYGWAWAVETRASAATSPQRRRMSGELTWVSGGRRDGFDFQIEELAVPRLLDERRRDPLDHLLVGVVDHPGLGQVVGDHRDGGAAL